MPDIVLRNLNTLLPLTLTSNTRDRNYYYSKITDEETEAYRDNEWPPRRWVAGLVFEPRQPGSQAYARYSYTYTLAPLQGELGRPIQLINLVKSGLLGREEGNSLVKQEIVEFDRNYLKVCSQGY